ncbi:hypothetical protein MRX96_021390 [Rhipicephalus microplus]
MKVERRGIGRKESKTNRRHSTPTGHESDGRRTGGSVALHRFPSLAGLRTTPWGEEAADGLKGTKHAGRCRTGPGACAAGRALSSGSPAACLDWCSAERKGKEGGVPCEPGSVGGTPEPRISFNWTLLFHCQPRGVLEGDGPSLGQRPREQAWRRSCGNNETRRKHPSSA